MHNLDSMKFCTKQSSSKHRKGITFLWHVTCNINIKQSDYVWAVRQIYREAQRKTLLHLSGQKPEALWSTFNLYVHML